MKNFIHGPEPRHYPVDLSKIIAVTFHIRSNSPNNHYISFISKHYKEIVTWVFDYDDLETLKETFKNIARELESKNINDTVKL